METKTGLNLRIARRRKYEKRNNGGNEMSEFSVAIKFHTKDADEKLNTPEQIRIYLGSALDELGIEEEIDYTLEVKRVHP
jgi:hypothetical protein